MTPKQAMTYNAIATSPTPITADQIRRIAGIGATKTVYTHIRNLRRAGKQIKNIYNLGYIIAPDDSEEEVLDGSVYKPNHVGDPLLDALRREHPGRC